jgi:hypothetical protein
MRDGLVRPDQARYTWSPSPAQEYPARSAVRPYQAVKICVRDRSSEAKKSEKVWETAWKRRGCLSFLFLETAWVSQLFANLLSF